MRDLVPYCFLDQLFEVGQSPGGPFVGSLVDGDAVGQDKLVERAPVDQRPAFIETQQTRARRFGFNDDGDIVHPPPVRRRDAPDGAVHETVEFVR